jgi:hypothetical protein
MRLRLAVGVLLCGLWPVHSVSAQAVDPNLAREVAAVQNAVALNSAALRQYTWTEHTEVLVDGEVKSSRVVTCRYDGSGKLIKTPVGEAAEEKRVSANSNNPRVRKKAAMEDYIERSISLIHYYVPPKPEQIQSLVRNGSAFLGQSQDGKPQIRFEHYFQAGDSLVLIYDPTSKELLRGSIGSNLGSPKDPVTLDAVFETLPDGVNHLASATLNATRKKVQVRMRNDTYQKAAN